MGYKIAIALLFLVLPNFATAADADGDSAFKPEIVNIPLNKVYVPVGFDDNDRVQIVVEGDFPNTCYKIGPYTFHMNEVTRRLAFNRQRTNTWASAFRCRFPSLKWSILV